MKTILSAAVAASLCATVFSVPALAATPGKSDTGAGLEEIVVTRGAGRHPGDGADQVLDRLQALCFQ